MSVDNEKHLNNVITKLLDIIDQYECTLMNEGLYHYVDSMANEYVDVLEDYYKYLTLVHDVGGMGSD